MTGTDCRGSEHDIVFVWSISSGKRTVLFDGQEVHYSSSRSGVFDYSWTMRGTNHVLKIVAHASPPMSTTPGFRQYDFFVDGLSFFRFPKVFRLGLNPNDPRAASAATEHSLALRGNRYKSPDEVLQAEIPSNPDEVRSTNAPGYTTCCDALATWSPHVSFFSLTCSIGGSLLTGSHSSVAAR
jgi:hypothetical protein